MIQEKKQLFTSRILKQGEFLIKRRATLVNGNGDKIERVSNEDWLVDNKYISKSKEDSKVLLNTDWHNDIDYVYDFYMNLYGIVMMDKEDEFISSVSSENEFRFRFAFGEKFTKKLFELRKPNCIYEEFKRNLYNKLVEENVKRQEELSSLLGSSVTFEAGRENDINYIEYNILVNDTERYGVTKEELEFIQLINIGIITEDAYYESGRMIEILNKNKEIQKENNKQEDVVECLKRNKKLCFGERFKLLGWEDLQLSTQILMKEAIKNGIEVKVIDRTENFISLKKGDKVEYVKEATKTSLDSYITVLIMENKVVTKRVVESFGICVPKGVEFDSIDDAVLDIDEYVGLPVVIKPKSTNFGIGISIFPEGASKEDLIGALKIAFSNDKTVLLEEFVKGKEYRFLVIDGEVAGILNRVPANVKGDGIKTIEELVAEKNLDPLRGKGYKTPLEKINIDDNAKLFLKQSNLDEKYIPKKDEVVYLRENSNISTGGDSVDYTDDIPERFKKIAVEAAASAKARICGVDMIIEDYKDEQSKYSIIELNFNPAIHIHSYPYIGKERDIAGKILKLLF